MSNSIITPPGLAAPSAKPPVGKPSGAVQSRKIDTKEQEAVIMMQKMLSALSKAVVSLIQNPEKRDEFSEKTGVTDLESFAGSLVNTGAGTGTPYDGDWGSKTTAALQRVSQIKGANVKPNKPGNSENTIIRAQQNRDAIAELMGRVELSQFLPSGVIVRPEYYDKIPLVLTSGSVGWQSPDGKKGERVRPGHLDTLWNFYDFLTSNKKFKSYMSFADRKDDLKKLAEKIKDSNIVRIGQEKVHLEEAPEIPEQIREEGIARSRQMGPDELSIAEMDNAIKWIFERSKIIYGNAEDDYEAAAELRDSGRYTSTEGGERKPAVTEEDVAKARVKVNDARAYHNAAKRLLASWNAQVVELLGDGDPRTTAVNRGSLNMWPEGKIPRGRGLPRSMVAGRDSGGKDQGISRERDSGEDFDEMDDSKLSGVDVYNEYPNGPLDHSMDLLDLQDLITTSNGQKAMDWINSYASGTDINYTNIKRMSPDTLGEAYRGDPSKSKRAVAVNVVGGLIEILKDVYETWKSGAIDAAREMPGKKSNIRRSIDKQNKLLYRVWIPMLAAKKRDIIGNV